MAQAKQARPVAKQDEHRPVMLPEVLNDEYY